MCFAVEFEKRIEYIQKLKLTFDMSSKITENLAISYVTVATYQKHK